MFHKFKKSRLALTVVAALLFCNGIFAQYHSLLWKISGPGVAQPSYLYGTMHTADSRVFQFSKQVEPSFKTAKNFAMELDPSEGLGPELLVKLMMDEKYSLAKLLRDSDYHFIDSILKKNTGTGLALYDRISPIVISALLEQFGMSADEPGGEATQERDFLDMYFYRKAKKQHKKIIGLEIVQDQLNALNSLSYEEQAGLLHEELISLRKNEHAGKGVLELYVAQDLDGLLKESDEAKLPPKFYAAMITSRNVHMAKRISELVLEKQTFIAVGALHLPGEEGVISLLRKKGFVVEEVRSEK